MKRNDVILVVFFIIATLAMTFYVVQDKVNATADQVQVYSDGKVVKNIPFPATDQTFEVTNDLGHITVQIENGVASVIDADCRDQICVHTKPIDQGGEMIVCLPNKMYVEILKKDAGAELDALSQ